MTYVTDKLTDANPFPKGYSASTSTPWGKAQVAYKYAPGIINYSCAGHGGFHLSVKRNAQVHQAWRDATGWYEEDCEWAIVAVTFPEMFAPSQVTAAHASLKNYNPHEYRLVVGPVGTEDSYTLRQEAFAHNHREDLVSTSASGDWADWVPEGFVGVTAVVGGPLGGHWVSDNPHRRFLVPVAEYAERGNFGFVIDPETHKEVK